MSTDQENAEQTAPDGGDDESPDWWHRDHPTFTALTGFFAGLAFLILVPAAFAGVLNLLLDYETAEDWFPFVAVLLVVPLALVLWPRTRRFGLYMALGMVITAVVVAGVAALVLWYLVSSSG